MKKSTKFKLIALIMVGLWANVFIWSGYIYQLNEGKKIKKEIKLAKQKLFLHSK